jgi:demethylmenaquinone methyltransferase/2-methoxy-6-polyprenyl-1,4-benzoquinol methylase
MNADDGVQMSEQSGVRDGSGAMFDTIAADYDRVNAVISLGFDRGWRRELVARLALAPDEPCEVLDVACGTGDVAVAIARAHPQARVVGLDASASMLDLARDKARARALGGRLRFQLGDAQRLPFDSARFAACCMAFGIRNMNDRLAVVREMARVTRPGGMVAVLELGVPRGRVTGPLGRFYIQHLVPRLGGWLSGGPHAYRYLERSVAAFPPPGEVVELLRRANLEDGAAIALSFGACHLFVGRVPSR